MARTFQYINGNRVASGVAGAFHRMNYDYKRDHPGEQILVTSGVRTWAEQLDLYNDYRAGRGNLALHPSNPLAYHVDTNPRGMRALDIRDSGADPGILTPTEEEARWLRANCSRYGFKDAGYYFVQKESWHIEYQLDPWAWASWMALPGAPANVPTKPKPNAATAADGDDDMLTVSYNGHLFNMDTEFVKHFTKNDDYEFVKNVVRAKDDWIVVNSGARMLDICDALGIPRNVINFTNGSVLNPQTGNFEAAGVWSRSREILAKLGAK